MTDTTKADWLEGPRIFKQTMAEATTVVRQLAGIH